MSQPNPAPPNGYVLSPPRAPFSELAGPFFMRSVETGVARGFRVLPHHCNGLGIAHGGLLMTFADELLGRAATEAAGVRALTLRFNADILSMAREGDWIDGTAEALRITGSLAFVEGRLQCGTRVIVQASGLFKLMRGREHRAAKGLTKA